MVQYLTFFTFTLPILPLLQLIGPRLLTLRPPARSINRSMVNKTQVSCTVNRLVTRMGYFLTAHLTAKRAVTRFHLGFSQSGFGEI